MALHIIKMASGIKSLDALRRQVEGRGRGGPLSVRTKNMPTRADEVLDGGSLYWAAGGSLVGRQAIVGLERGIRLDGTPCAIILVAPELVAVSPVPRKPWQGWRYMEEAEAPPDLSDAAATPGMPESMRAELAALGLL